MKNITLVLFITTIMSTSLLLFSITRKNYETCPTLIEDSSIPLPSTPRNIEENFVKTYTNITGFYPFPDNYTLSRELLTVIVGKENMVNGSFIRPSIYVKKCYRLGNNILQLSNGLFLAEVMNVSTVYIEPDFCFINTNFTTSKGIRVIATKHVPREALALSHKVYDMYNGHYCPVNRVYEFASQVRKNLPHVETDNEALYIHIRSGDIFNTKPCSYYGQPPMCFYESIIEKWNFKKIFILCEDTKNPTINAIAKKYRASIIVTSVPETVSYILRAKNLAISLGSFVPSILKLLPEDDDKRIFRYDNSFSHNRILWRKFIFTKASDYYRENLLGKKWRNTKEQRQIMLNETCGDDWKISMYSKFTYSLK